MHAQIVRHTDGQIKRYRARMNQMDRQADRQSDGQIGRQSDSQAVR